LVDILQFIISKHRNYFFDSGASRDKDLAVLLEKVTDMFDLSHGFESTVIDNVIHRFKKVDRDWNYFYEIGAQSSDELETFIQIMISKRYNGTTK
jgi:hypothetical protein